LLLLKIFGRRKSSVRFGGMVSLLIKIQKLQVIVAAFVVLLDLVSLELEYVRVGIVDVGFLKSWFVLNEIEKFSFTYKTTQITGLDSRLSIKKNNLNIHLWNDPDY
jgi:hypothetical protein